MIRSSANSLGEVVDRHGCVALLPDEAAHPGVEAHASVAVARTSGGIAATLAPAVSALRSGYEIVEIYVKTATVYEPLVAQHLAAAVEGAWAVVARKRHPSNEARIVGIMLAKDEADAIPEVVSNLRGSLDALYYYAADQATRDAIVAASVSPGWARAVSAPPEGTPYADGYRQVLLECARRDAETDGDLRPLWIMVVQGDEIYHDDLRQHVQLAQVERATVMTCQVATFLLHESQQEGWNWTQPLESRLRFYIWDFGEHLGFLDYPWVHYVPSEHMRAHPHGAEFPGRWARARPVRKHYPFRSPEQARARIEDRLKSGWQPHYENYRNIFMKDEAAGRPVKPYFGWFPDAERVEGVWK